MNKKTLPLPDQTNYQYSYEQALNIASKKLNEADIEKLCQKAGAEMEVVNNKKSILLEYIGNNYRIALPELEVTFTNPQASIQPREKLLMLHYIINADGSPLSGNKLTYKEIPGSANYSPTFRKRAIKPLLNKFGHLPKLLVGAASPLGGTPAEYGDTSVTIYLFKKIPLTFVLWMGDEEFPAEGNILFDSSISNYLSAEDITVACETLAWKMVKT